MTAEPLSRQEAWLRCRSHAWGIVSALASRLTVSAWDRANEAAQSAQIVRSRTVPADQRHLHPSQWREDTP